MNEVTSLPLQQIVQRLRNGELSSVEMTQAFIERIERLEPLIKAYITFTPEQALAQARKADETIAAWRKAPEGLLPPLTGVPISVKDVLAVDGIRCTCGSKILENFVPPYTATAVSKLQRAGVVILGKTNTDEYAMGSSTENSAYGVTHNPWDLARVPGGSSGGSAAVVAAQMSPVALGTDTGGSVRQPAAFCGVVGLKPTYGRVSRYGLVAYGSSLDCVGVLGRNVPDVATVYSLMAGHDPLDATSMDLQVPAIELNGTGNMAGVRVGVPDEYFIEGIQPEVETKVREAIVIFESLGAEITRVSLPHTEYALPVYYLIAPAEASANLARFDGVRYGPRSSAEEIWDMYFNTRGELFGPEVKRRIMLGTYALSAGYYDAYYGQAQKVRTLIRGDFDRAFEDVDVIAAPVSPTTAFPIGGHGDDPLSMYLEDVFTLPANLAGVPGISFPVGFDNEGLPVGMQLMGPHFLEANLLRSAHTFQQVTDWHRKTPELPTR